MKVDALAQIQLDDAHRACLSAICSVRLIAGNSTGELLAEAQRLHAGLCTVADEIAELRSRARMADA